MAKLMLLCGLVFLFSSCNKNPDCQNQELNSKTQEQAAEAEACPEPEVDPHTDPEPVPGTGEEVPNEALTFDAQVELFNFEREDEDKLHKAIEIIKSVIGSKEFRDRVLNFTYDGKHQFVDNEGYTNAEIYQILLDGREELKPEVDNEMDLELQLYYSGKNVVGYTYPSKLKIFMNTKYFDPYTPSEVAGNVFHEWTHKLGFSHDRSNTVKRKSSVPYALGYLIRELGKQYE